jgi:hypothetical protein
LEKVGGKKVVKRPASFGSDIFCSKEVEEEFIH